VAGRLKESKDFRRLVQRSRRKSGEPAAWLADFSFRLVLSGGVGKTPFGTLRSW
jgi:hypothetical protein